MAGTELTDGGPPATRHRARGRGPEPEPEPAAEPQQGRPAAQTEPEPGGRRAGRTSRATRATTLITFKANKTERPRITLGLPSEVNRLLEIKKEKKFFSFSS